MEVITIIFQTLAVTLSITYLNDLELHRYRSCESQPDLNRCQLSQKRSNDATLCRSIQKDWDSTLGDHIPNTPDVY